MIPQSVAEIIAVGLLPYPVKSIEEHGGGLINFTYKINTKSPDHPNFLLQKINSRFFRNVDGLQHNIRLVTDHIRKKLEDEGCKDIDRHVLTPECIQCNGSCTAYYWDHNGDYWRLYVFIEDANTFEKIANPAMAELAGKAFGKFHRHLSDFDTSDFNELLPNFHNTPLRLESLRKTIEINPEGRLDIVGSEVDFLLSRGEKYSRIVEMGDKGLLPKRIIHQDPKFNNVLFDKNGELLCVIDLDTVMPGYVCYDLGDSIRTGANRGDEDDRNPDNVRLDMDICKGIIKGYISEAKAFLTPAELETLAFGPALITYEHAVRFLDDYLDGDKYFKYKTSYPQHNLVRTRAQIKLLQCMEESYDEIADFVKSLS